MRRRSTTPAVMVGAMPPTESYNPWSVVNLVFHHLVDQGLHPVLGEAGDPGAHAEALLRALGIEPAPGGNRHASEQRRDELARIRAAVFGEA